MDPYLEGIRWPGFHHDLATEIKRQLTPSLRPRYDADASVYFLWHSDEGFGPTIGKRPRRFRVPHSYVQIRDLSERRLVTVVEILSPPSKEGQGRKQYLRKRSRLLLSPTNVVEIDLLRKGRRLPMEGDLPLGSYFIFVNRAEVRPIIDVWPVLLSQALPKIPVPLSEGDGGLVLDLQYAVTNVYDLGGYDAILDYQHAPEVPLSPRDAAWANRILKDAGLRK
jgi:hypothetical protein